MRPSLVIRCLPAYLLETSPSYFSIPFCASQKPYQTALSYLSYLSHLFILVMCLKCLFSCCKFMMVCGTVAKLWKMLHGLRDRSVHALMIIINVYHIVYIHLGKTPMFCGYGNELKNKLELELDYP